MNSLCTSLLVLSISIVSTAQSITEGVPRVSSSESNNQAVNKLFADCDNASSPGCAVAVIQDGKVVHKRGYGMASLEYGAQINGETIFGMASISKQFTAILVAILAEKNKLSLDDDIRKFVPEIPDYPHKITIRQLIYHTSGVRDYFPLWYLAGKDIEDTVLENEVLQMLARQKDLNFKPGEEHLYSNSGYFLLELIIKRAGGRPIQDLAEEHIFRPLAMKNTFYLTDNSRIIKNKAMGYSTKKDGVLGAVTLKYALPGAGGVYSNLEDFIRWNENFYSNRLGTNPTTLIQHALTSGKLNSGKEVEYGYGIGLGQYRGLKTFSHSGTLGGYRTFSLNFPENKFGVIVFCNLLEKSPTRLSFQIADIYLEKLMSARTNSQPQPSPSPVAPKLSEGELAKYLGRYSSSEIDVTHRVLLEGGQMFLQIAYNPPLTLQYQGENTFTALQNQITLKFSRKGDVIDGYSIRTGRIRSIPFSKV